MDDLKITSCKEQEQQLATRTVLLNKYLGQLKRDQ
jgi:hypothetical protein